MKLGIKQSPNIALNLFKTRCTHRPNRLPFNYRRATSFSRLVLEFHKTQERLGTRKTQAYKPVLRRAMVSKSSNPMVWIDCEMTGLNLEHDKIIQIVCYITDAQLNILDDQGFEAVIQRPKALLDGMNDWCTRTHGNNGLTQRVIESRTSPAKAAKDLLAYIKRYVPEPRTGLLCGNSIHADLMFFKSEDEFKEMIEWLHYRIGDVSSIKEFARRWCGYDMLVGSPNKTGTHEARSDILESIEEAKYYREVLFKGGR